MSNTQNNDQLPPAGCYRIKHEPLPVASITLGLLAILGLGAMAIFGGASATKMNIGPLSGISPQDESLYIQIKQVLKDAGTRIAEGGGLGNQDEDLLRGLEEALEAAKNSGDLAGSADVIIKTAGELGHSTETLLP